LKALESPSEFSPGATPKSKKAKKVKVTGTYRKVKKMRRYTFYNEIEAVEVK
jgi:hypothetical protein